MRAWNLAGTRRTDLLRSAAFGDGGAQEGFQMALVGFRKRRALPPDGDLEGQTEGDMASLQFRRLDEGNDEGLTPMRQNQTLQKVAQSQLPLQIEQSILPADDLNFQALALQGLEPFPEFLHVRHATTFLRVLSLLPFNHGVRSSASRPLGNLTRNPSCRLPGKKDVSRAEHEGPRRPYTQNAQVVHFM